MMRTKLVDAHQRTHASRVPTLLRDIKVGRYTVFESAIEVEHMEGRMRFLARRACAYDYESKVVGANELRKYMGKFDLYPNDVQLLIAGVRAAWNLPPEAVAI